MSVLAVSDFLHSVFIILVATPFILLWGCALFDLIRGHHTGWAIVGWMVVILVIPIIGPMIYFALRKPTHTPRRRAAVPRPARPAAGGCPPPGRRSGPRPLLARVEHEQRAGAVPEDHARELLRLAVGRALEEPHHRLGQLEARRRAGQVLVRIGRRELHRGGP